MKGQIFWLLTIALIATSCSKDLNDEFLERKQLFVGSWMVIEDYKQFDNGMLELTIEREFELQIWSNGLALERNVFSPPEFQKDTTQWFYQLDPEQIVFIENVSGQISNSVVYDVESLDQMEMIWSGAYTVTELGGNELDIVVRRVLSPL